MRLTRLGIFVILSIQSTALAQTQIRFTSRELSAGAVLMKPELNRLEIDEQAGTFTPGPSLRALGVDELKFDLNLSGVSQLAGIRFNHLLGKTPEIRIEGNRLLLIVPVQDQARAARSVLGSINIKNTLLKAKLGWRSRPDGTSELYVASTAFSGNITGTGALRPSFMIALVEKLLLSTLANQAEKVISRPAIQEAIQKGLLSWAKLSTGQTWREIAPGSPEFYTNEQESGLQYLVQ